MEIGITDSIISFISSCAPLIFEIWGIVSFIALVIGAFTRLGKAAWRFGLALFKKKIAIVASDDDCRDLEEDLADSGLIKKKNIEHISDKHLAKVNEALLLVVVYGYLHEEDFKALVRGKNAQCGLIVYCSPENGYVSKEDKALLGKTAFTTLCNFRGRLVNDVLLMMLSTSFKKSDLK